MQHRAWVLAAVLLVLMPPPVAAKATLTLASGDPLPGDYIMAVRVSSDFTLVPPANGLANANDTGHLLYFRNNVPCSDVCSGGSDPLTANTSFTFRNLEAGDIIGAELVQNDHRSLSPPIRFERTVSATHAAEPMVFRFSDEPYPGTYEFRVFVKNFILQPPNSTSVNETGQGHIEFLLNGNPCEATCAGNDPNNTYATANTTFTYFRLAVNDNLTARLVDNLGFPLGVNASTSALVQAPGAPRPAVSIVTTTPNEGTYTMTVRPTLFIVVAPNATQPFSTFEGSLQYLLNDEPCTGNCSADVAALTDQLNFTYHGLAAGDRLTIALVHPDGSSFTPAIRAVQLVATPVLQVVSENPRIPNATLDVVVKGFTLVAPTTPVTANNAGTGHLHYLVKRVGDTSFGPCTGGCANATTYATNATSFTFFELVIGDEVAVELVNNDHSSLASPVFYSFLVTGEKELPINVPAPALGLLLAAVLVALVLRRR